MRWILAALSLIATTCCSASRTHTQSPQAAPSCDATGVWRVELGEESLEVTVDPALARVELPEESIGADSGTAVALDVPACRLHVVQRTTQRYEEGYGNTDSTLHLEFPLGAGRRPVTGVYHVITLDPPGDESFPIDGVAERRASWTR
jgi:hypothetical protein